MASIRSLFALNIGTTGKITCTEPSPEIYLLTFELPPDNRLTTPFCATFLLALDIIAHRYPKGVVVTTSGISKFYSNGLDYESAIKSRDFFPNVLYPLWKRLLTFVPPDYRRHKRLMISRYPMPTIALINGHAFAGGLMTAMMHDYRIMNPHRGFLCVNELEFGAPLPGPMASIFRQKIPSPNTYRNMVLEAKRYNALEALKEGIVDGLGGLNEVLIFADEMKLRAKGKSGVYGRLKAEMWRETVGFLNSGGTSEDVARNLKEWKLQEEEQKRRVEDWERRRQKDSKSKL